MDYSVRNSRRSVGPGPMKTSQDRQLDGLVGPCDRELSNTKKVLKLSLSVAKLRLFENVSECFQEIRVEKETLFKILVHVSIDCTY